MALKELIVNDDSQMEDKEIFRGRYLCVVDPDGTEWRIRWDEHKNALDIIKHAKRIGQDAIGITPVASNCIVLR